MSRANVTPVLRSAIKMAAAATLAMGVVELLRLPSAFWAPLSALATLQAQIGASLVSARNYIFANVVGILVGATVVTLAGDQFVVAGIGIFFIAVVALALRLPPAGAAAACGVVPVIYLAVHENAFEYGLYRFFDVLIGLGSAILVSMVIFPTRAVTAMRDAIAGVVEDASALAAGTARDLAAGKRPAPELATLSERLVAHFHDAQGLIPAVHVESGPASPVHTLMEFYVEEAERLRVRAATIYEDADGGIPPAAGDALAANLIAVGGAADATATALAAAIRSGDVGRPSPDARAAVSGLRAATDDLTGIDVTTVAHGADLLRLHSIVRSFDELTGEAERLVDRIEGMAAAAPAGARPAAPAPATTSAPVPWWRRVRI